MLTVHSHPDCLATCAPLGGEPADRALRVLAVDDHRALRTGMFRPLEEQPDLVVVDAVESAKAAPSLTATRSMLGWSIISSGRAAVCGWAGC